MKISLFQPRFPFGRSVDRDPEIMLRFVLRRGRIGMDIKAIWLEQLKSERRLTRETIAAMIDGDVQFRTTPQQMSYGGQALHLISAQETLMDALNGHGWQWERGVDLEHFPTLHAILDRFDATHAAELAYYENLEPEQFFRSVSTAWGAPEPLLQLAMGFLTHEAHHRGQMVVYLRLKGMKPAKY
jgi:uncharacterized damage-inducible protein DinB